jgi:hypothetical protein
MYNWEKNQALLVPISVIILVAVSTTQLSSTVVSNGNIPAVNKVYATLSDEERQSRIEAHGIDNTPMNFQLSNPRNEIAQAPPSPPGPPFAKQVLQVRVVNTGLVTVQPGGGSGEAVASCAPDEVVVGGGMIALSDPRGISLDTESEHPTTGPINPTDWQYGITNVGPNDVRIAATALCAKLVDAP